MWDHPWFHHPVSEQCHDKVVLSSVNQSRPYCQETELWSAWYVLTPLTCFFLVQHGSYFITWFFFQHLIPAYDVMGPLGKLWVEVCIIGYLIGCCIAYVVVLGDLGPELLGKLGFSYSLESSRILLMTCKSCQACKCEWQVTLTSLF